MRISVAILFLSAAVPVSAADSAPDAVQSESVNASREATLSRARDVLDRWERVLSEEGPDRISASNVCRMYLDAWATVDLDRAIELERTHRCRSSQGLLANRLAAAHRWDDVLAMMDADPGELHYDTPGSWAQTPHGLEIESARFQARAPEFWARVACYGAKIGDMEIVDLAGRRVEMIAATEPFEAGRPPRPSERVALARFYVAASRLDALRQEFGVGAEHHQDAALPQTQHVLSLDQRKALNVSIGDLWRAAGHIVPEQSWYLTAPQVSSFQGFAALESWEDASNGFGLIRPERDNFVGDLVQSFQQERPSAPRVRIGILPPDLSRSVTSAWLTRQTLLGRTSVALTTLWLAPGSDAQRAGVLAIMSRYLPPEESALAATWRDAADDVLRSVTEIDDAVVRALLELSLAYSAAGDADNAARCIDATFAAVLPDTDDPWKLTARYETRQVLLQAVAALPQPYSRLPEVLAGFGDREFGRARLPQYQFQVDGLMRRMDLTRVIPESRIPKEVRYSSHADYHEPHDAGNWLAAMEAAVRHHAGNPAWASTYRSLAVESVQKIGLEATLDWCRNISDPSARFAAEIAAVQEAVRPWRKSLPEIDADDPEFVTPAVPWPSGC